MKGNISLDRSVINHPVVGLTEHPERFIVWIWLLLQANWGETEKVIKGECVKINRGQLLTSFRFISSGTGVTQRKVRTVIKDLKNATLIDTAIIAGQTMVTICKYSEYQLKPNYKNDEATQQTTQRRHSDDTAATQNIIQDKIPVIQNIEGKYFFEGKVIKLNQADYDRWKNTYHAIPDFKAALQGADDWISGEAESVKKKWFNAISGLLAKKHQEYFQQKPKERSWLV